MEMLEWRTRNTMYMVLLSVAAILAVVSAFYIFYNPFSEKMKFEFPLEDVYPLTAYSIESGKKVVYTAEIYLPLKPGRYVEQVMVEGLNTCKYVVELYDSSGAKYRGESLEITYKATIPILYQRISITIESCSAPAPQALLRLIVERK